MTAAQQLPKMAPVNTLEIRDFNQDYLLHKRHNSAYSAGKVVLIEGSGDAGTPQTGKEIVGLDPDCKS